MESDAPVKVVSLEMMLKVPNMGRCAGSLHCGTAILCTDRGSRLSDVWLMVEEEVEEKVEHRLRLNIRGIHTRHHRVGFFWNDKGGEERMVVLSIFVFV